MGRNRGWWVFCGMLGMEKDAQMWGKSSYGALLAGPIDSTSVMYIFLVFHKSV